MSPLSLSKLIWILLRQLWFYQVEHNKEVRGNKCRWLVVSLFYVSFNCSLSSLFVLFNPLLTDVYSMITLLNFWYFPRGLVACWLPSSSAHISWTLWLYGMFFFFFSTWCLHFSFYFSRRVPLRFSRGPHKMVSSINETHQ